MQGFGSRVEERVGHAVAFVALRSRDYRNGAGAAADLGDPFLRGSTRRSPGRAGPRWDGVYFGAQAGMSVAGIDFAKRRKLAGGFCLRNTPSTSATASPLRQRSTNRRVAQLRRLRRLQHANGTTRSSASRRTTAASTCRAVGDQCDGRRHTRRDGTDQLPYHGDRHATVRITDYGTLRVRGGWAAGIFMPYATVGFAVGARGSIGRSARPSRRPRIRLRLHTAFRAPRRTARSLQRRLRLWLALRRRPRCRRCMQLLLRARRIRIRAVRRLPAGQSCTCINARVGAALQVLDHRELAAQSRGTRRDRSIISAVTIFLDGARPFLICGGGTPLPNERLLSGRIDHGDRDARRAAGRSALFVRPLRQAPRLDPPSPQRRISRPLAPRQGGKAKLKRAIEETRAVLEVPADFLSASCRPPIPARSRWRCGRCSARGPSP